MEIALTCIGNTQPPQCSLSNFSPCFYSGFKAGRLLKGGVKIFAIFKGDGLKHEQTLLKELLTTSFYLEDSALSLITARPLCSCIHWPKTDPSKEIQSLAENASRRLTANQAHNNQRPKEQSTHLQKVYLCKPLQFPGHSTGTRENQHAATRLRGTFFLVRTEYAMQSLAATSEVCI